MFKSILLLSVIAVVVGASYLFSMVKGPDLRRYESLKKPRITTLPDTLVLEVPFETSTEGLKNVFGFLFKTYFKIKGVPKKASAMMPAIARYENNLDFAMEKSERAEAFKNIVWKGVAAIPLTIDLQKIPVVEHETFSARLTRWHYGETAEILHIGPYEKEAPTIQKIREFIASQGYEISGYHEEVYLRGPGLPWNRPKNYYTIIRYPVRKKSL